MGLLSLGTPLSWQEAKKYASHIQQHGIQQFLNIYHRFKNRTSDRLLFGDEVEYMVLLLDHDSKNVQVCLRAGDILDELKEEQNKNNNFAFAPEYALYMIEGIPGQPFGSKIHQLVQLQENMEKRRLQIRGKLKENEMLVTMASFGRLGCDGFVDVEYDGDAACSLYVSDNVIQKHARFKTLTKNIRERRGKKVCIPVPIYKDINTPSPFLDPGNPAFSTQQGLEDCPPDHVHLDCMCFGMGCCCLQITFQACCIEEATKLYDGLAVIAPLMLALTAASPVHKGYLTDVDCRWNIISASVDDRTEEERGEKELLNDRFVINKSRYDSIDSFLNKSEYNDLQLVYDTDIYNKLLTNGVDELLARHIAHLFIRDPLVIYRELIDQDDSTSSDHFENIQSTNWQTMRFKPPPPNNPDMGWRVEFRPMEVQLSDFDNAAFGIFIVLLTRAMLSFNLNFYIPITKVDENMQRAQKRDAINTQLFHFRKEVFAESSETIQLTLNEIFNGSTNFPGLIKLINSFLSTLSIEIEIRCKVAQYLDFIGQRAAGTRKTVARFMREFVMAHPAYKGDSVVDKVVFYDWTMLCGEIDKGKKIPGFNDHGECF